ncbi:MAG: hypothetical protein ABFS37_05245 [Acidobacteriota bacterium]
MGRLRDLRLYLDGRKEALGRAEAGLVALQEKFETFFAEIAGARESELRQLIRLTVADRSVLPGWYNAEVDQVATMVERELDEQFSELQAQRLEILQAAEAVRTTSGRAEKRIRGRNSRLDTEEEELKKRNASLLEAIEAYNRRIKALGTGFGFFLNLFKMRRLAEDKARLDREHGDIAARIEALRARWLLEEGRHVGREEERTTQWTDLEHEAATLSAKIEALEAKSSDILVRSTVERVVRDRRPEEEESEAGGAPCPRCRMTNPATHHFCHICALRLGDDREDFDGSLEEIGEINRHFERFSSGMEGCQEIIGLVRGMISGVEAFTKSVADVQASEDKYPLSKLEIDVPQASREFGAQFDRLADFADQDYSLHPALFADRFNQYFAEIFTETNIQAFFETMGEELSRQAEAQW